MNERNQRELIPTDHGFTIFASGIVAKTGNRYWNNHSREDRNLVFDSFLINFGREEDSDEANGIETTSQDKMRYLLSALAANNDTHMPETLVSFIELGELEELKRILGSSTIQPHELFLTVVNAQLRILHQQVARQDEFRLPGELDRLNQRINTMDYYKGSVYSYRSGDLFYRDTT